MGNSFGQRSLGSLQGSLQVAADDHPFAKIGGVTLDWGTFTALAADTTYLDGVLGKAGEKVCRYGQIITRIGVAEVQTVTVVNATGGTFTITLPTVGEMPAQTTAALAYNASAAVVQAALQALPRVGVDGAAVALAGGVYTITFSTRLGDVPQVTVVDSTTGAGHAVTPATTTPAGTNANLYGPYDPAAADGRAVLANGDTYVVNRTVKELDEWSNHPEALFGGYLWRDRLIVTTGTHTLAAGPTVAEFLAAFPRVQLLNERPA